MIPKIIHYCWLGEDALPEKLQACIDSWKKFLPDYEIRLWNTKTFDVNSTQWTREAFEQKKYAFASDYIRFYALYHFGGIYLDSDIEVLKSYNDLLDQKFFVGFEYAGLPEAATLGVQKGLSWVKACLDWYEGRPFIRQDGSLHIAIAPLIVQMGLETTYATKIVDTEGIQELDGGRLYPIEYFSPKNSFTEKIEQTEKTYSIHHYNSGWQKQGFITRLKKTIHASLICILGKPKYNSLIYKIRKKTSRKKIYL